MVYHQNLMRVGLLQCRGNLAALSSRGAQLFAPVDGDRALRWKGSAPPETTIGWMLGGPGTDTRRVLALGTGQRNIAAALVVASETFSDPQVITMVSFSQL
jgi:hypothetical protein